MNECYEETIFAAYLLAPFASKKFGAQSFVNKLDESCLVNVLSHNKVVLKFEESLKSGETNGTSFLDALPNVKLLCQNINAKIARDMVAFSEISEEFSKNKIKIILIKSDGSFPYESDNVDVLVPPERFQDVIRILKAAGYVELPQTREPHKFLFRNKLAFETLPLHIHTRVEWEGTQFASSSDLWVRAKPSDANDSYFAPSPEDCILITIAHLFFENHEIKLTDLLKINSKIGNFSVDWGYVLDHSKRLHWDDALVLSILLMNDLYYCLYGRNMLDKEAIAKVKTTEYAYLPFFRRIVRPFCSDDAMLKIPYAIVVFFFLRRVLLDTNFTLRQKSRHVVWIASDIIRRRSRKER